MKRILLIIGSLLGGIFPYSFAIKLNIVKKLIYTGYISKGFASFGNSVIYPKVRVLIGQKYITVGNRSTIGANVSLTAWDNYKGHLFQPSIVIGSNVSIGDNAHISCVDKIVIMDGVLTGKMLLISDNSHGRFNNDLFCTRPVERPLFSKGPIIIENNVWIGDKVSIIGNVRVGKGSVIAANTVVSKDVPPYSLVAGVPGQVLKQLVQ